MRTRTPTLWLSILVMLFVVPSTANASVVQCANESDSCEVSNEDGDWVSCGCIGEGTGGEEWTGLGADELMEVCLMYLSHCNGEGTGDDGVDGESTTEDPGCDESGEEDDGAEIDGGEDNGSEDDDGQVTYGSSGDEDEGGEGDGGVTFGSSGGEDDGDEAMEDSGGEGSGGVEDPIWGCSVSEGSGFGLASLLGLLGLLGLRRRSRV